MVFNSLQFLLFFLIVYLLYLRFNHRWQNCLLLIASCIFYGAWDWRFLLLMFVSVTTDFVCARGVSQSSDPKVRKLFLGINIAVSLGILGFFKYFNFFVGNLDALLTFIGLPVHFTVLQIVLPVGISFYTFQAMSYVFDVYRGIITPTRSYWDYALFVTYFPHLVAGPIMKAKDLLPQILNPRKVELSNIYRGGYFIFLGLFQKMLVADNLAKIVDPVFSSTAPYEGSMVLIAVYAFAFQIYYDFCGYSHMARGLGQLMGFDIIINFNNPYFSRNPREFWQRWHISLSTWLRDYVYIPLGGNKGKGLTVYRNLLVTMLVGGIWHGANWTYVIWGAFHGAMLAIHRIFMPAGAFISRGIGSVRDRYLQVLCVILFFHLTCVGWLIFRAPTIDQAWSMAAAVLFNFKPTVMKTIPPILWIYFLMFIPSIIETAQRYSNNPEIIRQWPLAVRFWLYAAMAYLLIIWGQCGSQEFIYFQF